MPPRGLEPRGLLLVDKPAGPSSFDVIARIRRRTGARTGHAGTLDPFATGLLLVLSGAATRLAPWFVGLDKRYLTDVDLAARTATGDTEGEVVEERAVPDAGELELRVEALQGEIELPIPPDGGVDAVALQRAAVRRDRVLLRLGQPLDVEGQVPGEVHRRWRPAR